jgi:integrase-like protein
MKEGLPGDTLRVLTEERDLEPPSDETPPAAEPTFHEFASRWLSARRHELRATTYADYRWRLVRHLLPFFADYKPSDITITLVDRYREDKLIEREETERAKAAGVTLVDHSGRPRRGLSNESINKTLALLANMLDDAVERGWLASNPAQGRRRRLRASRPQGSFLEADQLHDLLLAAQQRDARSRADHQLARREISRPSRWLGFGSPNSATCAGATSTSHAAR